LLHLLDAGGACLREQGAQHPPMTEEALRTIFERILYPELVPVA
jgi:hypothetical protein